MPSRPVRIAVLVDVCVFARNTQFANRLACQARRPDANLGHLPGHQVVGEISQRMPNGRKLPIKYRDDAGLGRVEDHIIEPEIAVNNTG